MTTRPSAPPPAVLDAVLERITYANDETGYTVARVSTSNFDELLTVVGPLLGAQVGESLRLTGRWRMHPKYGRQFEAQSFTTVLPATAQGIRRYLGSGLIKGIGPVMASRMVDHFNTDILRVIEEEPSRLLEVTGLGPKRTQHITDAWQEQKAIKEVMVFLQTVDVSTSLAVRIYKTYGNASIETVRRTPYRLAADVWGIGFKTADTIARAMGIPHDSPDRVHAGLQYTLSKAADDGHCFLPEPELLSAATRILQIPWQLARTCLDALISTGGAIRDQITGTPAIYLIPFHRAECSLAGHLHKLQTARQDRLSTFAQTNWDQAFAWLHSRTDITLADQQRQAIKLALTTKVSVLTGGPGCGKSFTVRSIIELAAAKQAEIILVAPTGRAAKRLAELTGHPAATIHRLLQLQPGGEPKYDRTNPLDADLVVVDECSMVDLTLANKLVKAIPPGAHLLLVGDVDQLPSVGPGSVLADLLAAAPIPRVRLTEIFRQSQHSGIVVNAHRINAGKPPLLSKYRDFLHIPSQSTEATAELTVDVVANRIARHFNLDPRRDVQVLTPTHRGPTGAGALNKLLQQSLTPQSHPERRHGSRLYRVGDKVTQLRNNYDKGAAGIFNGTVGVITAISLEDHRLTVRTDEDETIHYAFDELDQLTHAYAITIHRSQGSEYPAVVIPLTTGPWSTLQRNLLYTAITRAKQLVVLIGPPNALAIATQTPVATPRNTTLTRRLELQHHHSAAA